MKGLKTEGVEIVEFQMARKESARRRAERARQARIERLLQIIYRLVITAAVLMVMAGAGVIDSAPAVAGEITGALMMLGGAAVLIAAGMMWEEEK